jgi:hypothetical protein
VNRLSVGQALELTVCFYSKSVSADGTGAGVAFVRLDVSRRRY